MYLTDQVDTEFLAPKQMRKNSSKERSKSPLTGVKSLHPDEDRVKLKDYRARLGPGS